MVPSTTFVPTTTNESTFIFTLGTIGTKPPSPATATWTRDKHSSHGNTVLNKEAEIWLKRKMLQLNYAHDGWGTNTDVKTKQWDTIFGASGLSLHAGWGAKKRKVDAAVEGVRHYVAFMVRLWSRHFFQIGVFGHGPPPDHVFCVMNHDRFLSRHKYDVHVAEWTVKASEADDWGRRLHSEIALKPPMYCVGILILGSRPSRLSTASRTSWNSLSRQSSFTGWVKFRRKCRWLDIRPNGRTIELSLRWRSSTQRSSERFRRISRCTARFGWYMEDGVGEHRGEAVRQVWDLLVFEKAVRWHRLWSIQSFWAASAGIGVNAVGNQCVMRTTCSARRS